jgi:hypothetical protein
MLKHGRCDVDRTHGRHSRARLRRALRGQAGQVRQVPVRQTDAGQVQERVIDPIWRPKKVGPVSMKSSCERQHGERNISRRAASGGN